MKSDDIDRIIEEMITDKNSLRKAAEMALGALDSDNPDIQLRAAIALRQALEDRPPVKSYAGGKPNYCTPEVTCKTDPQAPHGFDRNASHSADRYVCECESWEPADAVNMTPDRVDETAKSEHEPFIYIRADTEMPFGGYEHCGQHDPGAFPVYLAPPKQEYQYEVVAEHADGTYTTKRIPKRQWVGLTDEELYYFVRNAESYLECAKGIEAKLKEKNS